jgi:hypothetical protein
MTTKIPPWLPWKKTIAILIAIVIGLAIFGKIFN